MALLELCCRGGGSWLGAHSPEGRGCAGWERRQGGLAQRKGSALQGMLQSFLNSSSHNISGFAFYSFPDHIPDAWRFSSWEVFRCALSFTVSTHRPHPNLCALSLALPDCRALPGCPFLFAGGK